MSKGATLFNIEVADPSNKAFLSRVVLYTKTLGQIVGQKPPLSHFDRTNPSPPVESNGQHFLTICNPFSGERSVKVDIFHVFLLLQGILLIRAT